MSIFQSIGGLFTKVKDIFVKNDGPKDTMSIADSDLYATCHVGDIALIDGYIYIFQNNAYVKCKDISDSIHIQCAAVDDANLYLAVGYYRDALYETDTNYRGPIIFYSINGIKWAQVNYRTKNDTKDSKYSKFKIMDICWYSNSKSNKPPMFIAVGNRGLIMTTEDGGVNWKFRHVDYKATGTTEDLYNRSVSASEDMVVVGCTRNKIIYSTDTITWKLATYATEEDRQLAFYGTSIEAMIYHNDIGIFVGLCEKGYFIVKSTSGENWFFEKIPTDPDSDDLYYRMSSMNSLSLSRDKNSYIIRGTTWDKNKTIPFYSNKK